MADVENLEETIQKKLETAYDKDLEAFIQDWIEKTTGCKWDTSISFQENLRDGVLLCELLNAAVPGCIPAKKINRSQLAFKQIENISTYLETCTLVGMEALQLFDTIDLYESKNMLKVLQHLSYLQRHHKELKEPIASNRTVSRPKSSTGTFRMSTKPKVDSSANVNLTPSVSSLSQDLETKEELKYNPELERMARQWLEAVLIEPIPGAFVDALKSGVILCRLMNTISPGIVPKINTTNIAYQQMENIRAYLKACQTLGLRDSSLFETVDLYEGKNINLVINNIHVLAAHVSKTPSFKGPHMEEEDLEKTKNLFSVALIPTDLPFLSNRSAPETLTDRQSEVFVWLNNHLEAEGVPPATGFGDLRSAVKLLHLLKAVTRVPSVGPFEEKPSNLWQCMQNASLVLRILFSQTLEKVFGCNARDIVNGSVEAITSLLEYIRAKFDLDYYFAQLVGEYSEVDPERPSPQKPRPSSASILLPVVQLRPQSVTASRPISLPVSVSQVLSVTPKSEVQNQLPKEVPAPHPPIVQPSNTLTNDPESQPSKVSQMITHDSQPATSNEEGAFTHKEKHEKKEKKHRHGHSTFRKEKKHQHHDSESPVVIPDEIESKYHKKKEKKHHHHNSEHKEKKEKKDKKRKSERRSESTDTSTDSTIDQPDPNPAPLQPSVVPVSSPLVVQYPVPPPEPQPQPVAKAESPKRERPANPKVAIRLQPTDERVERAQFSVRQKISSELFQTEKNYVESLLAVEVHDIHRKFTNQQFHQTIIKSKSLSDEDEFHVFGNLTLLVVKHQQFLSAMTDVLSDWKDTSCLGDLFLQKLDFMQEYRTYIHNYNASFVACNYLTKKNPEFSKQVDSFERDQRKTTLLNLESLLIMPVQRVPRYILLLKDLLKYTPERHKDFTSVPQALDVIKKHMDHINSGIDKEEIDQAKRIQHIEKTIDGDFETFLKPKRRYVREGNLMFRLIKENKSKKSTTRAELVEVCGKKKQDVYPYWILFNDALVCCETKKHPEGEKLFDYKATIPLTNITEIHLIRDEYTSKREEKEFPRECSFSLLLEGDLWTVHAKEPQERDSWIKDLSLAVMHETKKLLLKESDERKRCFSVNK